MLVVSRKGTNGYRGRFNQKAIDLVKAGTRVGMMHIGPEDAELHCHVCDKDFPLPEREAGHPDAWGQCPHCETPFVFNWVGAS
jgi:hypothetical protein